MTQALRKFLAAALFRLWPTPVGLETLMHVLNPPPFPGPTRRTQLKGYPLQFEYRPKSYMGRFLSYRGLYEEGPLATLPHILRPGDAFLDVGANAGLYAVIAAHLVGSTGVVIACEPQTDLAALMARNASTNHLHNIHIRSLALGRASGRGLLYQVTPNNDGQATLALSSEEVPTSAPVPVEILTVAQLLADSHVTSLRSMKIDVEGAELEVLAGAGPFLSTEGVPYVLWEGLAAHLARFGATLQDVWQLFWNAGYRVFCHSRGHWWPIREPRDHQACRRSGDFLSVLAQEPLPPCLR